MLGLAMSGPGLASENLTVDARTAFDTGISTKQISELGLHILSARGGELELRVTGVLPEVTTTRYLRPGEPMDMWLPVGQAAPGQTPVLTVRMGEERPVTYPLPGASPAVAVLSGETAIQLLGDLFGTVAVAGERLPRYAPAYAQIPAVVLDRESLTRLDEFQLRALLDFAGTCGRLMLIDAPDKAKQVFANRAACSGRFLSTLESKNMQSPQAVAKAFRTLVDKPGRQFLSQESLRTLLPQSVAGIGNLSVPGLFLAGYLLVFTILVALEQTRLASLAFCVIGVLLALLIWQPGAGRSFVAWAEMDAGDRVARYAGIEGFFSTGRGTLSVPSHSFGSYPVQIIGDNTVLQWGRHADERQLRWRAALLSRMYLNSRGSFPVDPNLRAQANDRYASVCNHGAAVTQPALLYWRGSAYAIPALEPGAAWSTDEQPILSGAASRRPEIRLLRTRAAPSPLALLQSLPISTGGENDRAWLLQVEPSPGGEKPCNG